ncbi:MAG TPA: aminoacyl-tRNA hydrolase, partial [Candidatus Limnocylindria bacterium]|nr:aminoacyl-tRNA hydrolase [Candidatus Limnocylindria bacterium]
YMNDSGQALRVICNFYKLNFAKDMLVIHDDVDLPFGTLRGTESSSAAGHNGILSIINDIGTQNFGRLRVGIESREAKDNPPTNVFVLENFTDEELSKLVADVLPRVRVEIEKFIGKN